MPLLAPKQHHGQTCQVPLAEAPEDPTEEEAQGQEERSSFQVPLFCQSIVRYPAAAERIVSVDGELDRLDGICGKIRTEACEVAGNSRRKRRATQLDRVGIAVV